MSEPIDRGVPAPPVRRTNLVKAFREEAQMAKNPESVAPTAWPSFADADRQPVIVPPPAPEPEPTAPADIAMPVAVQPAAAAPFAPEPVAGVQPPAPATASRAAITPERITFDLPVDLRLRVRTVFKKTRNDEDDESFGDMMRKMVAAECRRREALYNGGQQYPIDARPLQSGRSIL